MKKSFEYEKIINKVYHKSSMHDAHEGPNYIKSLHDSFIL